MAASTIKTFTLTLNNTCLVETRATVYFRLNSGSLIDMSKNIAASSSETFIRSYNLDEGDTNTMHVTGDYINDFILT
jgi:hypothetical protein